LAGLYLLSVPKENLVSRIVKNHASGLVAESGDVGAFCRSADTLKKDDRLRIEMGKNARNYAEKTFQYKHNMRFIYKMFQLKEKIP
jgi:hypothetical protein